MCKRKECWRRSTRTSISISQRKRINTLPRDMPCLLKNVFKWRMAIVWERERERDMQKNAEKYSSGKVNRPGAKSKFFFFPHSARHWNIRRIYCSSILNSIPFRVFFFFFDFQFSIFFFRFFFNFSVHSKLMTWWAECLYELH